LRWAAISRTRPRCRKSSRRRMLRSASCSLLVNSAAIFEYDDVASIDEASMDAHYAANLRAPVLLARHFAEQLPKDARGLIVNLLDQKVFNLNPDFLSYTIMKAALASATELLAMALAPRIRVCGVAPGLSLRSGNQTDKGFADAHSQDAARLRQRSRRHRRSGEFHRARAVDDRIDRHGRWRPEPCAPLARRDVQLRPRTRRGGSHSFDGGSKLSLSAGEKRISGRGIPSTSPLPEKFFASVRCRSRTSEFFDPPSRGGWRKP
jgi:NAD(P)-dependent dehydrogenase (short-subunit alcohol dehydrogenase family)